MADGVIGDGRGPPEAVSFREVPSGVLAVSVSYMSYISMDDVSPRRVPSEAIDVSVSYISHISTDDTGDRWNDEGNWKPLSDIGDRQKGEGVDDVSRDETSENRGDWGAYGDGDGVPSDGTSENAVGGVLSDGMPENPGGGGRYVRGTGREYGETGLK